MPKNARNQARRTTKKEMDHGKNDTEKANDVTQYSGYCGVLRYVVCLDNRTVRHDTIQQTIQKNN